MNGSKKPENRPPLPSMTSGSFQKAQETITQKLREYYDSVEDQGIPDRFLDLLEKLDEAEQKAQKAPEKNAGKADRR